MIKIFIDTNFWLLPYIKKIDIFSEIERLVPEKYEILVSESVIEELKKIQKKGNGKEKIAAEIALILIEKKAKKIPNGKNTDKLILKISEKENMIICTNDKNLRKKLKEKSLRVIGMRGKEKLSFI
ncbi:MAG: nucleotide-binding protein [Candidatus Altiarchaeota archaeon]